MTAIKEAHKETKQRTNKNGKGKEATTHLKYWKFNLPISCLCSATNVPVRVCPPIVSLQIPTSGHICRPPLGIHLPVNRKQFKQCSVRSLQN